jgi:signal transduction histidine kinase
MSALAREHTSRARRESRRSRIATPRPVGRQGGGAFERHAFELLATADDFLSGITSLVALIRSTWGATGVEWWSLADDGGLVLIASAGEPIGERTAVPVDRAGTFMIYAETRNRRVNAALGSLASILRRRLAEERLATAAARLAQRNQALDDYAGLVAHELKGMLALATLDPDPTAAVERAAELVDALLEAARVGCTTADPAPVQQSVDEALRDVGAGHVTVLSQLPDELPVAPRLLRVVFRNLIANAVAAGARHIRLSAAPSDGLWEVAVDDYGAGVEAGTTGAYAGGSGIGFSLTKRMVERCGGRLELGPSPGGGARATLRLGAVAA